MNTTLNNYNASVNRNLSSLLSQIQDDGPAYADSMKQSKQDNVVTNKRAEPEAIDSAALRQYQNGVESNSLVKKEINQGVWLQLLLLLVSTALLLSTLFRFDAQTDDIEKSLSLYDEKMQETIALQSEQKLVNTTKINKKLQLMQKDLQLIKTDYTALDKKYVAIEINVPAAEEKEKAKEATQISEQANIQEAVIDDIDVYKSEMFSLKNELQKVKNKLGTKFETSNNTFNREIKIATNSTGSVVSLASFAKKDNAEKMAKKLRVEGLLPEITTAIVNEKPVYRLSVSGFLNKNEAELFIRKASEQYGIFGSRIKES